MDNIPDAVRPPAIKFELLLLLFKRKLFGPRCRDPVHLWPASAPLLFLSLSRRVIAEYRYQKHRKWVEHTASTKTKRIQKVLNHMFNFCFTAFVFILLVVVVKRVEGGVLFVLAFFSKLNRCRGQ